MQIPAGPSDHWVARDPAALTVISFLNFERDVVAIRIAMVEQKLTGPPPSRIKIGEIPAWHLAHVGIGNLVCAQDAVHVEPHACRNHRRQHNKSDRSEGLTQVCEVHLSDGNPVNRPPHVTTGEEKVPW